MKCPKSLLVAGFLAVTTDAAAGGPVSKVVNLLEDLKAKIDKDAEVDEKDFEKHKCWCEKVEESKKEMIAEETALIQTKTSEIEVGESKDEVLDKKILKVKDEIASSVDAKKEAANLRSKQHDASAKVTKSNTKMDTDLSQAIGAVKALGGSSAQSINDQLSVQRNKVQQDEAKNNKTETKAQASYKNLSASMQDQLKLLEETERTDTAAEAETEMEIAEDTEVKTDTEEQLKADKAFLAEATASCLSRKIEYNNRTKLRQVEIGGIDKALSILDKQRELLSSTFKNADVPSFMQLGSDSISATAAQNALSVLQAKASKTHNLRLALLAAKLRKAMPEGAFSTVLSEIEKMMKKMKTEAAHDVKEKDTCTKEYFEIAKKTKKLAFLSQTSAAKIEEIGDRIAKMKEEKSLAEKEISEIESDLNQSLALRTEENAAYKSAKADDQTAIKVLGETSKALKKYYEEQAAKPSSLLQSDPSAMSDKRKKLKQEENKYTITDDLSQENAASTILAMLDHITGNLGKEIADATEEEAAAQRDYEKAKGLLLASKAKLEKKTVGLATMVAQGEQKRASAADSKTTSDTDLADQKAYKASIKDRCDEILNKFDDRASDRESEMDGLIRAKELLSGSSLVQKEVQVHEQEDDKSTLMNYLGLDQ